MHEAAARVLLLVCLLGGCVPPPAPPPAPAPPALTTNLATLPAQLDALVGTLTPADISHVFGQPDVVTREPEEALVRLVWHKRFILWFDERPGVLRAWRLDTQP